MFHSHSFLQCSLWTREVAGYSNTIADIYGVQRGLFLLVVLYPTWLPSRRRLPVLFYHSLARRATQDSTALLQKANIHGPLTKKSVIRVSQSSSENASVSCLTTEQLNVLPLPYLFSWKVPLTMRNLDVLASLCIS